MSMDIFVEEAETPEGLIMWVEDMHGREIDIGPRTCSICGCGVWEGYLGVSTDNVFCVSCHEVTPSYKMPDTMYTQWGIDDFRRSEYRVLAVTRWITKTKGWGV